MVFDHQQVIDDHCHMLSGKLDVDTCTIHLLDASTYTFSVENHY